MECSYRRHEILPAQNSRTNRVYVSRGIVEMEWKGSGGRHAAKSFKIFPPLPNHYVHVCGHRFPSPNTIAKRKYNPSRSKCPFFLLPASECIPYYKLSFIVFRIVKNNFCAFAFKLERNVELIFERGFDGGLFFQRDVKE